jgi:enamine deaminase RidA (YjgF/YER057c/UK114 family)
LETACATSFLPRYRASICAENTDTVRARRSGPADPVTGGRNLGPIAEQVRQTLRKMAHVLESAGFGLDRIVKMTVVLAEAEDYGEMKRVWREFIPVDLPALTACALQLSNGNGVENRMHCPRWEKPVLGRLRAGWRS